MAVQVDYSTWYAIRDMTIIVVLPGECGIDNESFLFCRDYAEWGFSLVSSLYRRPLGHIAVI